MRQGAAVEPRELPEPPAAPELPPELEGYLVHRLLGRGATSRVWSATAPDGGDVAVKVVPGAGDQGAALAEATLLCRLRHPHVVALRAVERWGDGLVLVLDRAHGGSLGALVRARGALQVPEVVTVVTVLAGALADLHARGLVHGDVAPGNVLFTADADPLLADWGLAAAIAGAGGGGGAGGTPGFADPAQLLGGAPSAAGDVHGLAAVAWYAVTGQVPPSVEQRVPLPLLVPGLPVSLAALLDEAMSPDPQLRPSAAELGARCAQVAGAEPVHLVPSDPHAEPAELLTHRLRAAAAAAQAEAAPTQRSPRRARVVRALGAVAAAAAVFTGAWAVSALLVDPARPAGVVAAQESGDLGRAQAPGEAEVAELAAQRAAAYLAADVGALALVDAPASPAHEVDAAAITAMVEQGTRVRGLAYDVRWAEAVPAPEEAEEGQRAVRAVVATSAHEQVLADGSVVAVPASGPTTSLLLLERHDGRWLLAGTA